jgi:putative oxidoreductase
MDSLQRNLPLVGRVLLSLIFLASGLMKLGDWSGNIAYMESKGFFAAHLFLAAATVIEIAGALMVILGWRARLGAAALALFTVVAAVTMHNFWSVTDGMMKMVETAMFLKNLTIVGGLLLVVAFGPGPRSINDK